jgi:hypothetical protein
MKTRKTLFVVLSVVILLAMSVSFATAQGPQPDDPDGDDIIVSDVSAAVMNDVVPIQGRLTNAAGNPVPNGSYSITASIYDVSSGGTARCTDADPVQVTNGLFNLDMDYCVPGDINGDQLYVGIKVGSDPEMTPRQPIYAVPYAWTVRPGAVIKGADSYIFVPAEHLIKNGSADSTTWDVDYTQVLIRSGNAAGGSRTIMLPITIPAVLFGAPARIVSMTVYYKTSNAANAYITATRLYKATDADSADTLINDPTDRNVTTATSYTLTPDALYDELSSAQGILSAEFTLTFADNSAYVMLTGVRLHIDHTP